ncbi:MAG: OsmC family protein [Chloroflexi bacterium]|jgi:uncharacterized OsmC-like protein|nr:OsmC family protein [Chloroflexota bacterium]
MELTDCVVEYRRDGGDGHLFSMTPEGVPVFQVSNKDLTPEGRRHWANRVLNAAALCCVATTLASDLIKRGAEVKSLTGRAASGKEKDSVLRTHINEIQVEIEVDIGDADQAILDECLEIISRDTLAMYSLREGIEVEASIKRVK